MNEAILVPVITIDEDKCTGCGTCVENCPQENLELVQVGLKKKVSVKDIDMCVACRHCQKFCPYDGIKVEIPGHELW